MSETVQSSNRLQIVRPSRMEYLPDPDVDLYVLMMIGKHFSDRTIDARASFARARLRAWGTYQVTREMIETYLAPYVGHTRRTYHDHLQALFSWLVNSGRLPANPMDEIPRPPTPKPRPRPLSRDDAARSLLASQGDMRSYLLLGRYAGLRAHEIAKFRGEDIDEENLYVFGKGGQGYTLPTHPTLWKLAEKYPRRGYWFPSARSQTGHITPHALTMQVSRHFAALGIEGASHRNRHLYGTNLLRGGANIRVVQELMRHADISTTVRYLGVDQEEKVTAIHSLIA